MNNQAMIVLNVPPSLEEVMIDALLEHESNIGFTSSPVHGHSTHLTGLTPAEQVSGRQRRVQFEIQMAAASVEAFLVQMRDQFAEADVHFWVLPVNSCGRLSEL